eukprot:1156081-Pelagomonas_calceolata.AAC.17
MQLWMQLQNAAVDADHNLRCACEAFIQQRRAQRVSSFLFDAALHQNLTLQQASVFTAPLTAAD